MGYFERVLTRLKKDSSCAELASLETFGRLNASISCERWTSVSDMGFGSISAIVEDVAVW
jgi:hypothetical protein